MRTKPVPSPPDTLEELHEAHRAVPLVPGSESDCCARLVDRLDLVARDEARTWLTFLRGLGLVAESDQGFSRVRRVPEEDALADAFTAGVFGAREVLSILETADEPLELDVVFERFESSVPPWERRRRPDAWRDRWRDRIEALLEWCVLLGLADRQAERYTVDGL